MVDFRLGDCLELMKDIPDGSVDLVLTDPPYGTTACKWDSVIPFEPMWEQLNRVIKPNGAICLFGSEPFSSALRMSNIKHFKYDWIWEKTRSTGHVHAKNMPMKKHEIISVFSNGSMGHASLLSEKRMVYNPQGIIFNPHERGGGTRKFGGVYGKRPSHKERYVQEASNYPSSILKFACECKYHSTQKPVALLEYLIRTYTNDGETVLDFTMGSGTTGVACVNTNRNFIGIELDEGYFNIAKKRIEEAKGQSRIGT